MAIKDAFLPPDFSHSQATLAATSVQCSLYQRLRKTYANRAGSLAWLLVRTVQPDHREHEEAMAEVMARDAATLAALSLVVSAARAAAKTEDARVMCATILEGLKEATLNARDREKASK